MTQKMLVSIIIPMRNAEPFVAATLRSLLAQRDVEIEIIVVNDGSTDRSVDVVQSFADRRIRIIAGPQRGISAAFNAGVSEARGEYLCRCDADDLYPESRLRGQAEFLNQHLDFGAICGSYKTVDPDLKPVIDHAAELPAGEITQELLAGRGRSHMGAYLFRTELLRRVGGCREWFITSEDADLQYRLAEITRIWFDPACAYHYRLHDSSITHAQKTAQRKFYEDCARDFLHQRKQGRIDDLQQGTPPAPPKGEEKTARSSKEQIQELLLGQAWKLHAAGRRGKSISLALRGCMARPANSAAWRSLLALIVKPRSVPSDSPP